MLGEDKTLIEADIVFLLVMARLTGNPLMQTMLSWLSVYFEPVLNWSGREDTTLLEHARIVNVLGANDVAVAVKMMGYHLNRFDPLSAPS